MAKSFFDPSQGFINFPPQSMDAFFHPKSIAIIGATEKQNSVGRTIVTNLINSEFEGTVHLINPKRTELFKRKTSKSISETEGVDLAVIVTPAKTVPGLVKECVKAKVKACTIISAGFKELGAPGIALENEILEAIKDSPMRIIGPNCLGVMNPIINMNATFAADMANPGNIAFISQSGAMCTSVLDWSLKEGVGFSAFVSIGSMVDVNWGDLIKYFARDPHTESILIYMESVGDARAFLSAARWFSLSKPIILIKAGKTDAAAKAAASHTGSLAGSDDAFQAAVNRAGILRVETISQLFDMAATLSKQPRPEGPNLTLITNAGGPAVLATDTAVFSGATMTDIEEGTEKALSAFLPEAWSHSNPVDILGDAGPETYAKSIEIVSKDVNTDGILVILTPQDMTDPTKTAQAIAPYATLGKPILASWMGGKVIDEGFDILMQAGIPCFEYPDQAAEIFAMMYRHNQELKALYETPAIAHCQSEPKLVDQIIDKARAEGRTLLTELESKEVLSAYEIPIVQTVFAETKEAATAAADKMGYPVVCKLHSETITHKTDVGGVKLNLKSKEEVAAAFDQIQKSVTELKGAEHFGGVTVQQMVSLEGYELILGSSCDPQFGPVILFGTGGQLVEIYKDRALALPPLNATLAHQLISQTKIFEALKGTRGRDPIDIKQLETIVMNFSELVSNHKWIAECDINPILASPGQLIALDGRIVLHEIESEIPKSAIRPYPSQYVTEHTLKDGTKITLRPIKPEDEKAMTLFHKELSEESVRNNYFEFLSFDERTAHSRLVQICNVDFGQNIRMIAQTPEGKIIGVSALLRIDASNEGEFRLVIVDHMQGKGLGRLFMENLISISREEGFKVMHGLILNENHHLIELCKKLDFSSSECDHLIKMRKEL
ncbi:MAG: GNAT family N-acetyltransferase [Simkaniaceae bacterium]|nr:GNAT family N-acetyltransferase [Simkaniaceae bacterium]